MGIPDSVRILSNTSLLTESQALLKSINSWCTTSLYSQFYSSTWRMHSIWSVVDLLCRNPHWWSVRISSAYGINFDSRMMDKILYVVDKLVCRYNCYSLSSPFLHTGTMIGSFHFWGNSSLFQIELTSLWISERIVLPLALILFEFDQHPVICVCLAFQ